MLNANVFNGKNYVKTDIRASRVARCERRFELSFHSSLDLPLADIEVQNISALAQELSVSRTTVIRVPKRPAALGVIASEATGCFPPSGTPSIEETLESTFMNMIGCHGLASGAPQRILSAPMIREFLIDLSRFGFVCREVRRYGYWKA